VTTPSTEFSTPTTPNCTLPEAVAWNTSSAEILDRRLLAEGARRPQHGHALGRFERQAGRHDFAPDGGDMRALERPRVGASDFFDHLRHAVGAEEGGAFAFLDLADTLGHQGALVQQGEQLLVDVVDLDAQAGQFRGGLWGVHGWGAAQAWRCSNSRM